MKLWCVHDIENSNMAFAEDLLQQFDVDSDAESYSGKCTYIVTCYACLGFSQEHILIHTDDNLALAELLLQANDERESDTEADGKCVCVHAYVHVCSY